MNLVCNSANIVVNLWRVVNTGSIEVRMASTTKVVVATEKFDNMSSALCYFMV